MSDEDPTAEELHKAGELKKADERLRAEFDRSRALETQTIQDFEKSLWLANSGAATVTIGFVTATPSPDLFQFLGCCAFVLAIVALLVMRMIGEINASRDRARRQKASERFFLESQPMSIFEGVRDKRFRTLCTVYRGLKQSAAILFILGCLFTLIGIYPQVSAGAGT